MMDFAEKAQRCHEYVEALEEERRKIRVFQRELPLCLELVTQAIETCKNQLSATEFTHELSECSEQSSGDRPVLEEFIPIKSIGSSSSGEEELPEKISSDKQKSEWLRSVQLWNQNPDPVAEEKEAVEVKKNGGSFQPYEKDQSVVKSVNNCKTTPSVPAAATSWSVETECGGEKEEKGKDGQRKQRRCWSPELHRRFLHALQQLGGSHTATPKQIRELMKVEGLTNDEVKSHLQKYRLHTRRPNSGIHNNSNQQPQFLVVGGIWVPGEATGIVSPTTNGGVYAPIPVPLVPHSSRPHQKQPEQLQSEEKASQSEGVVHSHSRSHSTSSSTHTTTTSRVF